MSWTCGLAALWVGVAQAAPPGTLPGDRPPNETPEQTIPPESETTPPGESPPGPPPARRDSPPSSLSPTELLESAEGDYRELQYRRASQALRKLLYKPDGPGEPDARLTAPDDKLRARELLGASLWYLDEKNESSREFERLLVLQPGHTLDKFVYPKPLLDFFEGVRNTAIEQNIIARVAEPTTDKPPPPTVLRITQREQSRAAAFMPFGVAQFEQDRPGWGTFFAASQGMMAAANVGTYVAYMSVYNSGDSKTTEALFISTIATGAVWIALTAWGIIDANVAYEPTRVVGTQVVPAEQAMPGAGTDVDLPSPAPGP